MTKSKGKIAATFLTVSVAILILAVSVLKSAKINLAYSPMVLSESVEIENSPKIDYLLAYPGKVNPDNPLWYAKVLRDKTWLTFTFKSAKKAELNLLFADKRLGSSLILFQNNKPDLALSTLMKSAIYLETAEALMVEDADFYNKIGLSALKHWEVIEYEILPITPEDLRPQVIITGNSASEIYKKVRDHMLSKGLTPPTNPYIMR